VDESEQASAIEPLIVQIRGHRVVLDTYLAELYGVSTKQLNQAIKRNRDRFPEDFAFQLTSLEAANLRSQFVTSSSTTAPRELEHASQSLHGGRRHLPWVLTEHGALMAANVLRSARAVQVSLFVVRAFVRLRQRVAANEHILARLTDIERTLLQHDDALRDLYQRLRPLLELPPDRPQRRIGFHAQQQSQT
jgi:hypothetical protein